MREEQRVGNVWAHVKSIFEAITIESKSGGAKVVLGSFR